MLFLLAIAIFVGVVGSTWWFGLWNNVLTLINFFIAALIASSFYESFARVLQESMVTYAYVLDFISLWILFFLSFGILRVLTGLLSPIQLKFNIVVDMIGRSIVCVWLAVALIFFSFFSLHLAPIPPSQDDLTQSEANNFQGTSFLGLGPGRMWMAFIQSRSRGALSASIDEFLMPPFDDASLHPDDQGIDCRVFDSSSRMPVSGQARRVKISTMSSLRNPEQLEQ